MTVVHNDTHTRVSSSYIVGMLVRFRFLFVY